MGIDDCNGCRSEDCDACATRRYHAKHEHCLDCKRCLIGERDNGVHVFGLHVGDQSENDGDRCTRCVPCVQECACDSEYAHELAEDEAMQDFLRNPGSPPAHWDAETVERVTATIGKARRS